MDKVKKIFISATVGLFILTLTNSCHKFPHDPFLSLRTTKKRLIRKDWTLVKYLINGSDITSSYNITPADTNAFVSTAHLWFNEENRNNIWWVANPNGELGRGWEIQGNQLYLREVDPSSGRYHYKELFPTRSSMVWKILELYDKKFKITTLYDNKWYELWFEVK